LTPVFAGYGETHRSGYAVTPYDGLWRNPSPERVAMGFVIKSGECPI
jgi:hypothetical protein